MKKIINGKLYNTDTARELGSWANSGDWRDFNHMEETLYRKKTGEFFLFGEGGPRTRYAETVGQNQWTGGSKILPLSWDDARQWAEDHLNADEYEAIFGEVSEGDENEARGKLLLTLPSSTIERIRRAAAQQGLSVSAYIESLL